jgi:hypothetical protein
MSLGCPQRLLTSVLTDKDLSSITAPTIIVSTTNSSIRQLRLLDLPASSFGRVEEGRCGFNSPELTPLPDFLPQQGEALHSARP